mgnify:CR=1 FL=1
MSKSLIYIAFPLALVACASRDDGISSPGLPLAECDASNVQSVIGERATQQVGERLLQLTGAATLRWVPPRTAVTMDFRADRLTVSYDDDMLIERISCG